MPDEDAEKKFYAKACASMKPYEAEPDGDEDTGADTKTNYKKQATDNMVLLRKYRAERDQLHLKYQAVVVERDTLKTKIEGLEKTERYARRYSRVLAAQAEGYVIPDAAEEVTDCEAMDDTAFDHHVEKVIKQNYQRVPSQPIFREAPQFDDKTAVETNAAGYTDTAEASEKAAVARKYSRKVREHALREGEKGRRLNYEEALAEVMAKEAPVNGTKQPVLG